MQQNENEIKKKKELFDLSLIFTEGDEDSGLFHYLSF